MLHHSPPGSDAAFLPDRGIDHKTLFVFFIYSEQFRGTAQLHSTPETEPAKSFSPGITEAFTGAQSGSETMNGL